MIGITGRTAKILRSVRIGFQIGFVFIFFVFFYYSGGPLNQFLYFDPLIPILNFFATGVMLKAFLLSLVTLVLTLLLGRFFCGWVCPFGAINQFFSWIFRKTNSKKGLYDKKYLKAKYFILIAVLVSALMGTNLGGWLDPFSLLTRSVATLISPTNYLLEQFVKSGTVNDGIINKMMEPVYDFSKDQILSENPHVSAQSVFIPCLFIFLLVMNYYKRRFFCNTLCTLGALLGLTAKIGFFRIKSTPVCTSCASCSRNCTYHGNPDKDYIKSECMVCFNCVSDCPSQAIAVGFELPAPKHSGKVDFGRRNAIGALLSGLVVASLPKVSIQSRLNCKHAFIRPPGSAAEKEFLENCIRCGNCVQSCPTSFIQPALLETGLEGIWTPVLNARAGSCTYDCNRCTQVCSTQAIRKLTLKEKQIFKIGTAVIDKNRCYTHASGFNCTVCYDKCPIPEKAIQFHETETWTYSGETAIINQIYVKPDLCIGCGVCENVCPRKDAPGIFVTAEDEVRESVTGDV